jgi:hypothetical protein
VLLAFCLLLPVMLSQGQAAASPRSKTITVHTLAQLILEEEPFRESSLYACMFRLQRQGLNPQQVLSMCEQDLVRSAVEDGRALPEGFDEDISGTAGVECPGTWGGPAAAPTGNASYKHPKYGDLGEYSWGGSGEFKNENGLYRFKGLSQVESRELKADAADRYAEAVDRWSKASEAWIAALNAREAANKTGDAAKIAEAEANVKNTSAAVDAAKKEREAAEKEAKADPNKVKVTPSVSEPVPDAQSAQLCAETLAFLTECDRVGWSTYECQRLQSQLEGCADPALIYPDPLGDGSVNCSTPVPSAEAVEEAVTAWCRRVVKHGPDVDPCAIEVLPGNPGLSHTIWATAGVVCGSPYAYVTEDSCLVSVTVYDIETRSVASVLLVARDKLGGPVWVFPASPPPGSPLPHGPKPY